MGERDESHPDPQDVPDLTSLHVRRAVDGDAESLEWIVAHFHPLLLAQIRMRLGGPTAHEHDVQDLADEVWLVALRRLGDLAPRDGRWAPVLVKFLGTTALNLCNNHLRRRIRSTERERPAEPDELALRTRGVVTRAAGNDTGAVVARALERLSDEKREVLVLRLLEQRGNQEIAEILGLAANTVAVRYRRALDELRGLLPPSVFDGMTGFPGAPG